MSALGQRRPVLASGVVLVTAAACVYYAGTSWLFAAPPLSSPGSGALVWGLPSQPPLAGRGATGEAGAGAARTSSAVAPAALAAAALLAAAVARRAVALKAPEGTIPRSERPKAGQTLPFGSAGQRLFSVRNRQFWDFVVNPKMYFTRKWIPKDIGYAVFFIIIHAGAFAAPWFFTWPAFCSFLVMYLITGMFGITLSYHRQLAHRSFKTPKFLEYIFAYCGVMALQSHPINWVSSHRHHHGGTETERDVHSPLDGFWWSHMGWLLDGEGTWMRQNKSNADDLKKQWYYRMLAKTYPLHGIVIPIVAMYALGGLPFVMWGFFFRVVWVWHVTWMVNSVSHVWGFKDWNTEDNSMNNWFVGLLAFGEGWHNNHHAFENSCRHGLKWWQVDFTWYTIKTLSFLGLASSLNYPSESKMRRLSFANTA
mmetsp:Transcript_105191/g.336592  ORF Transcript_105191/g.336592 Transcript_105191/m.336592 type:complete len:424 (+) Transcript_105191:65-1336(+)